MKKDKDLTESVKDHMYFYKLISFYYSGDPYEKTMFTATVKHVIEEECYGCDLVPFKGGYWDADIFKVGNKNEN